MNTQLRTSAATVSSLTAYKAIWFDAGDTLITIPETHKLFAMYLSDRRIDSKVDEHRIIDALNDAFRNIYYEHRPDHYRTCTPDSDREFWVVFYRYVLERLELLQQLDETTVHTMCHELYDLYISPTHYTMFEDVQPVLDTLSERGFRLSVVSNFAPTLNQILTDKGIADYFDPIIVSTIVGYEKPDPRIFQHTLEVTGLHPEEVLYIGDHEINDIWAPAQAGIGAIRIKRYDYQSGEGIHSLLELLA